MTIEVGGSSGGILKLVAFASAQIAVGASGDVLTVTAGSGQYIRINHLATSAATDEAGMTLTIDGVDVFSNFPLVRSNGISGGATGSTFGVIPTLGTVNNTITARYLREITCTTFTLTKVTGTTVEAVNYSYETLEAI